MKTFIQGLLFGLAYVAPIGMQNLYVINTAATRMRRSAYLTALITIFFDISLAMACFFGIGIIIAKITLIKNLMLLIGSAAVIYIGTGLVRSSPGELKDRKIDDPLFKVISICFTVTWLNPQAIIDGTLLLGGVQASLAVEVSKFFIYGVATASFLWFMSLSTLVSVFKRAFNHKVLKFINILCGTVIILYGLKLAYQFIRIII